MSNLLSNATSLTKTLYTPPENRLPTTNIAITRNGNGTLIPGVDPNLDSMLNCTNACLDVPETVTNAIVRIFEGSGMNSRDSRTALLGPIMSEEGWRFCPCFTAERTHAHMLVLGAVLVGVANGIADKQLALSAIGQEERQRVPD